MMKFEKSNCNCKDCKCCTDCGSDQCKCTDCKCCECCLGSRSGISSVCCQTSKGSREKKSFKNVCKCTSNMCDCCDACKNGSGDCNCVVDCKCCGSCPKSKLCSCVDDCACCDACGKSDECKCTDCKCSAKNFNGSCCIKSVKNKKSYFCSREKDSSQGKGSIIVDFKFLLKDPKDTKEDCKYECDSTSCEYKSEDKNKILSESIEDKSEYEYSKACGSNTTKCLCGVDCQCYQGGCKRTTKADCNCSIKGENCKCCVACGDSSSECNCIGECMCCNKCQNKDGCPANKSDRCSKFKGDNCKCCLTHNENTQECACKVACQCCFSCSETIIKDGCTVKVQSSDNGTTIECFYEPKSSKCNVTVKFSNICDSSCNCCDSYENDSKTCKCRSN